MNDDIKCIVRSGLFLAIVIVIQFLGKNIPQVSQFVVGPFINLVLIVATLMCGIWYGSVIGILTPWTAWILGQLASPLGPFIPFIMVGNCIFVIVFGIFRKYKSYGKYVGLIIGALLKFAFLYISATKLIYLFQIKLPAPVIKVLSAAMGIPQLVNALIGGALALIFIEILKKRKIYMDNI